MRPVHRMKMVLMSQVETDRGQVPWRISSLRPSLLKSCQQVCFPAERAYLSASINAFKPFHCCLAAMS
jgi:hypothetical protein